MSETISISERDVDNILLRIKLRDPHQVEFLQAAREVLLSLLPVFRDTPRYFQCIEKLCEPERVIQFRVPWLDDEGKARVNRGFRVQFNSAIGPYKGGLRFHPSVNLSVVKFLAFEQIFKNSLTGLMIGGGKGGSDFNPKGKSDNEVMRFCQSFMTELYRHIGPDKDIPAGDIGVGSREIGFMFGQYKRIRNQFHGVLTGKSVAWGGSSLRPEATGYGVVYYLDHLLRKKGATSLEGKRCSISGSGNVAQFVAEKLLEFGAVPVTFSDSSGYVLEAEGFSREQLSQVMELKNERRGRISEYCAFSPTARFFRGKRPWEVPVDVAIPCATQNELEVKDAASLVASGVIAVVEGANMPVTPPALKALLAAHVLFAPGKAANAGGVAVSGLEMSQDSIRSQWSREEVDTRLRQIMAHVYTSSSDSAERYNVSLAAGANIAGFLKVADAIVAEGCV